MLALSLGDGSWAATISGKVIARGIRDNGDAVVYVETIPGRTFSPPKDPVILDQINLTFVPHVLPIVVGTTVAFPNSDEVRHNVFSPSAARRFNLGTYPRGVTRTVVFDKAGEVVLLCNVHAEMSAFVIVLQNPHFAVTAKDGSYTINDVPAGKYVLKAYHERLKPDGKEVEVTQDKVARVDFELRK
ncbi:MAG: carboxypeptidase regulatory-like domain-containing protein [Acidobacteria bacterium]|nr:carboxypeptidase regulatory-like domain-containing protein [Acidobacteriota bacterium]